MLFPYVSEIVLATAPSQFHLWQSLRDVLPPQSHPVVHRSSHTLQHRCIYLQLGLCRLCGTSIHKLTFAAYALDLGSWETRFMCFIAGVSCLLYRPKIVKLAVYVGIYVHSARFDH